ncbi:hypothetical protein GCM10028786_01930 [Flaviaesturariibacter terrae]
MEGFRRIVRIEGFAPPQASRLYAYAGMALYESVVPGMPDRRSLAGQVPLYTTAPVAPANSELQYEAVVNEALYRVALELFQGSSARARAVIDSLHSAWQSTLAGRVGPQTLGSSEAFGRQVADALHARVSADGYSDTRNLQYSVPSQSLNPANWAPTGAVTQPLEPFWCRVKCFAMTRSNECEQQMEALFQTADSSAFYRQALELYQVSHNLSDEQKAIARWWSDGAGTATPPGHWLAIAGSLAAGRQLDLGRASEMYALLTIGLADAFISCWDAKYKFNLLRPQTYIRNYVPGGANWSSFIATPPFPEFPSGHSVSSGTAAEILTRIFGNIPFTDATNTELGLQPRQFGSFYEAANEAAMSRLYGGIHYRQSNEIGVRQGNLVARCVFRYVHLQR